MISTSSRISRNLSNTISYTGKLALLFARPISAHQKFDIEYDMEYSYTSDEYKMVGYQVFLNFYILFDC